MGNVEAKVGPTLTHLEVKVGNVEVGKSYRIISWGGTGGGLSAPRICINREEISWFRFSFEFYFETVKNELYSF